MLLTQAGTTYQVYATKRTLGRSDSARLVDLAATRSTSGNAREQPKSDDTGEELMLVAPWTLRSHPVKAQGSSSTPVIGETPKATLLDTVELEHHHDHDYHGYRRDMLEVAQSFNGLNTYDTRFANGGNQLFTLPASPRLSVGDGFVLEIVNTVLRVYDERTGAPLTPVVDLNTFFGLPPQVNRTLPPYHLTTLSLHERS